MYKILVLRNGSQIDVTDECQKAKEFFATRPKPIAVEFIIKDINIPIDWKVYKVAQGFNSDTGQPMMLNHYGLVDSVKDTVRTLVKEKEYQAVMIINDISNIPVTAGKTYSNWANFLPLYFNTGYMQIVYNPYLKQIGLVANAIKHEIMHDFCYTIRRYGYSVLDEMDTDKFGRPYFRNDFPTDPNSNFGFTLNNISPYISKLYPTITPPVVVPPVTGYRHFSERESEDMTTEFMLFADELRHRLGWALASSPRGGFRTPTENRSAGGVPDSAHLVGKARDWRVLGGLRKYQFIEEAQKLAKERSKNIGIGVGDNFCHLDVGHRAKSVVWNYGQLKD